MTDDLERRAREWLAAEFANALDDDPDLLVATITLIRTVYDEALEAAAATAKSMRSEGKDPVLDQEWNAACDQIAAKIRAMKSPTGGT